MSTITITAQEENCEPSVFGSSFGDAAEVVTFVTMMEKTGSRLLLIEALEADRVVIKYERVHHTYTPANNFSNPNDFEKFAFLVTCYARLHPQLCTQEVTDQLAATFPVTA